METILFGRPTIFRPRLAPGARTGPNDVSALYDLDPLRQHLHEFVDFKLLNSGAVRLSVATTDVVTGERVVFDTAERHVGPEHVVASCALLPIFAPVEVEGRLLGDGGLSANTPLDLILDEAGSDALVCFAVDLFALEGSRPQTMGAGVSRAVDLAFGNQTRRILDGRQREYRLREMVSRLSASLPPEIRNEPEIAAILSEGRTGPTQLFYLSYRGVPDELGPGKLFDFSRATIDDRWRQGANDMRRALLQLNEPHDQRRFGLAVHEIPTSVRRPKALAETCRHIAHTR